MSSETHVAVPENRRPATPVEVLKVDLFKEIKQVKSFFNGNEEEANRFMTAAVEYIRRKPELLEKDRTSLVLALMQIAQFRFLPAGVSGEAFLIPYGKEAKFQLGYQGIITLLYRTGKIKGITSNIIFEHDVFEYEEGLNAKLIHKPAMFGKPKGEPIGVYTIAELEGGAKTFKVMDKEAVLGIKELSKAKNSKDSPWNSDQDPELWMWKKTCLIQHAKLLPKTPDLQKAIEVDYEGSGLEKPRFDAAGPAVGRSNHAPEKPAAPAAAADNIQDADVVEDGKKCPAGKHPISKVHDGVCDACEGEALAAHDAANAKQ